MNIPGDADALAFLATLEEEPEEPCEPETRFLFITRPPSTEMYTEGCRALWAAVLRQALFDLEEKNKNVTKAEHISARRFCFAPSGKYFLHRQRVCAFAGVSVHDFERTAARILEHSELLERYRRQVGGKSRTRAR